MRVAICALLLLSLVLVAQAHGTLYAAELKPYLAPTITVDKGILAGVFTASKVEVTQIQSNNKGGFSAVSSGPVEILSSGAMSLASSNGFRLASDALTISAGGDLSASGAAVQINSAATNFSSNSFTNLQAADALRLFGDNFTLDVGQDLDVRGNSISLQGNGGVDFFASTQTLLSDSNILYRSQSDDVAFQSSSSTNIYANIISVETLSTISVASNKNLNISAFAVLDIDGSTVDMRVLGTSSHIAPDINLDAATLVSLVGNSQQLNSDGPILIDVVAGSVSFNFNGSVNVGSQQKALAFLAPKIDIKSDSSVNVSGAGFNLNVQAYSLGASTFSADVKQFGVSSGVDVNVEGVYSVRLQTITSGNIAVSSYVVTFDSASMDIIGNNITFEDYELHFVATDDSTQNSFLFDAAQIDFTSQLFKASAAKINWNAPALALTGISARLQGGIEGGLTVTAADAAFNTSQLEVSGSAVTSFSALTSATFTADSFESDSLSTEIEVGSGAIMWTSSSESRFDFTSNSSLIADSISFQDTSFIVKANKKLTLEGELVATASNSITAESTSGGITFAVRDTSLWTATNDISLDAPDVVLTSNVFNAVVGDTTTITTLTNGGQTRYRTEGPSTLTFTQPLLDMISTGPMLFSMAGDWSATSVNDMLLAVGGNMFVNGIDTVTVQADSGLSIGAGGLMTMQASGALKMSAVGALTASAGQVRFLTQTTAANDQDTLETAVSGANLLFQATDILSFTAPIGSFDNGNISFVNTGTNPFTVLVSGEQDIAGSLGLYSVDAFTSTITNQSTFTANYVSIDSSRKSTSFTSAGPLQFTTGADRLFSVRADNIFFNSSADTTFFSNGVLTIKGDQFTQISGSTTVVASNQSVFTGFRYELISGADIVLNSQNQYFYGSETLDWISSGGPLAIAATTIDVFGQDFIRVSLLGSSAVTGAANTITDTGHSQYLASNILELTARNGLFGTAVTNAPLTFDALDGEYLLTTGSLDFTVTNSGSFTSHTSGSVFGNAQSITLLSSGNVTAFRFVSNDFDADIVLQSRSALVSIAAAGLFSLNAQTDFNIVAATTSIFSGLEATITSGASVQFEADQQFQANASGGLVMIAGDDFLYRNMNGGQVFDAPVGTMFVTALSGSLIVSSSGANDVTVTGASSSWTSAQSTAIVSDGATQITTTNVSFISSSTSGMNVFTNNGPISLESDGSFIVSSTFGNALFASGDDLSFSSSDHIAISSQFDAVDLSIATGDLLSTSSSLLGAVQNSISLKALGSRKYSFPTVITRDEDLPSDGVYFASGQNMLFSAARNFLIDTTTLFSIGQQYAPVINMTLSGTPSNPGFTLDAQGNVNLKAASANWIATEGILSATARDRIDVTSQASLTFNALGVTGSSTRNLDITSRYGAVVLSGGDVSVNAVNSLLATSTSEGISISSKLTNIPDRFGLRYGGDVSLETFGSLRFSAEDLLVSGYSLQMDGTSNTSVLTWRATSDLTVHSARTLQNRLSSDVLVSQEYGTSFNVRSFVSVSQSASTIRTIGDYAPIQIDVDNTTIQTTGKANSPISVVANGAFDVLVGNQLLMTSGAGIFFDIDDRAGDGTAGTFLVNSQSLSLTNTKALTFNGDALLSVSAKTALNLTSTRALELSSVLDQYFTANATNINTNGTLRLLTTPSGSGDIALHVGTERIAPSITLTSFSNLATIDNNAVFNGSVVNVIGLASTTLSFEGDARFYVDQWFAGGNNSNFQAGSFDWNTDAASILGYNSTLFNAAQNVEFSSNQIIYTAIESRWTVGSFLIESQSNNNVASTAIAANTTSISLAQALNVNIADTALFTVSGSLLLSSSELVAMDSTHAGASLTLDTTYMRYNNFESVLLSANAVNGGNLVVRASNLNMTGYSNWLLTSNALAASVQFECSSFYLSADGRFAVSSAAESTRFESQTTVGGELELRTSKGQINFNQHGLTTTDAGISVLAPESSIEFRSGTLGSAYFSATEHATVSAASTMVVDANTVEITGGQLLVNAHDQVSFTSPTIALHSEQGDVHLQTHGNGNIDITINNVSHVHAKRDIIVRSDKGDVFFGSPAAFNSLITFSSGLNIPQGSHLLIPASDIAVDDVDSLRGSCQEGEIRYFRGFARTSFVSFPTQSYYRHADRNGPKLCVCSLQRYLCVNMG